MNGTVRRPAGWLISGQVAHFWVQTRRKGGLSVGMAKLDGVPNDISATLRRQARAQGGVITRRQAVQAGVSVDKIAWLLKRGDWRQVHRGVYVTFTGPVNRTALLWAAVLYAGRGAYLSHETAAEINGLSDDESPVISVTIPASRRISAPAGVIIHHSSRKAMTWRPPGIPPYTVVEETVIDLAQAAAAED